MDTRAAVAYGPRVLQGAFVTAADVYTYKLARLLCGERVGKIALGVQVVSWFFFYCAVRTYSNSMEMVLLQVALFYWFEAKDAKRKALAIAAVSVAVRGPSAAICWVYLGLRHLCVELHGARARMEFLMMQVAPLVVAANVCILVIDRIGYGMWTCTLLNFFRRNVVESISNEYGVHAPHWYLTQGLPVTVGTFLPFGLHGAYVAVISKRRVSVLVEVVMFFMVVMSLVGHKEFRFLLPILPLWHILAALSISRIVRHFSTYSQQKRALWKAAVGLVVLSNLGLAFYFSRIHQRACMDIIDFLANEDALVEVDFLTKCHATPFYSHMHVHDRPVYMRFLDCSPALEALRNVQGAGYTIEHSVEEEDAFKMDKLAFIRRRYIDSALPSHIVWEDTGSDQSAQTYLRSLGYTVAASFPNGFDGAHMHVYRLSKRVR